ncbi:hypothetical protein [Providencia manganoxydans]|uniref:hypothetical protein n=1 Tax=Providencia manganoxydans TaxID=2923283 RepID=UPI0034E4FC01
MKNSRVTDSIMQLCSKIHEQSVCHATFLLYNKLNALACKTPNIFVGYRQLEAISKEENIDTNTLLSAIQILANPNINVLIIKYLYITEDDETFEISYDEIIEAEKEKSLVHPSSGELVFDYKKHIFPFYSINIRDE